MIFSFFVCMCTCGFGLSIEFVKIKGGVYIRSHFVSGGKLACLVRKSI